MKTLHNLILVALILFISFIIYNYINIGNSEFREGLTNNSGSSSLSNPSTTPSNSIPQLGNGIAGNAAAYASTIKTATIKLQDTMLISKYRNDYETIILNMDDLINNLMLKNILTINKDNPEETLDKLAKLGQAKLALNNVMKYVDSV